MEPSHAALYKAFGDWIRNCYGRPVASAALNGTSSTSPEAYTLEITVPDATPADRIILQEDQREGQRILSYKVTAVANGERLTQNNNKICRNSFPLP